MWAYHWQLSNERLQTTLPASSMLVTYVANVHIYIYISTTTSFMSFQGPDDGLLLATWTRINTIGDFKRTIMILTETCPFKRTILFLTETCPVAGTQANATEVPSGHSQASHVRTGTVKPRCACANLRFASQAFRGSP